MNEWIKEHVLLEELTIRHDLQHVYYFDYQIRKRELETTLNVDTLRHDFHEFWMRFGHDNSADAKAPWAHIRERMKIVLPTIRLPVSYWEGPFHGTVSIVLSARYGRPIGCRFDRLLNVTNTAFEYYKGFLLPLAGHWKYLSSRRFLKIRTRKVPGRDDARKFALVFKRRTRLISQTFSTTGFLPFSSPRSSSGY